MRGRGGDVDSVQRTDREAATLHVGRPQLAFAGLERQLGQHLGTKVNIIADKQGKRGRVILEYYGIDHFDGLLAKMGLRTV